MNRKVPPQKTKSEPRRRPKRTLIREHSYFRYLSEITEICGSKEEALAFADVHITMELNILLKCSGSNTIARKSFHPPEGTALRFWGHVPTEEEIDRKIAEKGLDAIGNPILRNKTQGTQLGQYRYVPKLLEEKLTTEITNSVGRYVNNNIYVSSINGAFVDQVADEAEMSGGQITHIQPGNLLPIEKTKNPRIKTHIAADDWNTVNEIQPGLFIKYIPSRCLYKKRNKWTTDWIYGMEDMWNKMHFMEITTIILAEVSVELLNRLRHRKVIPSNVIRYEDDRLWAIFSNSDIPELHPERDAILPARHAARPVWEKAHHPTINKAAENQLVPRKVTSAILGKILNKVGSQQNIPILKQTAKPTNTYEQTMDRYLSFYSNDEYVENLVEMAAEVWYSEHANESKPLMISYPEEEDEWFEI